MAMWLQRHLVGLEFKFHASKILHKVANVSPPLQHLRKQLCCLGVSLRRWAPLIARYTLLRNIANMFGFGFTSFTIATSLMNKIEQLHVAKLQSQNQNLKTIKRPYSKSKLELKFEL